MKPNTFRDWYEDRKADLEEVWWRLQDWWEESVLRFWCRLRGHPGPVYYNASGFEPDWSCKRCGEDLG